MPIIKTSKFEKQRTCLYSDIELLSQSFKEALEKFKNEHGYSLNLECFEFNGSFTTNKVIIEILDK